MSTSPPYGTSRARPQFTTATLRTYVNDGVPMSISTTFTPRHEFIADSLHVDFARSLGQLVEGRCPVDRSGLVRVGEWGHCRPCARHYRTYTLGTVQVIDCEECPSAVAAVLCGALVAEVVACVP